MLPMRVLASPFKLGGVLLPIEETPFSHGFAQTGA